MSAETPLPQADRDAIRADLIALLVEVADGKLEGVEIDPSVDLLEYGYVDSLSAVLFLGHIADRYGVEIEDVELVEQFQTVDKLVERLAGAGS